MALLHIDVKLVKGAKSPLVIIDQKQVDLNSQSKGSVDVDGSVGDGSTHQLFRSWVGPAGAALEIEVKCGDKSLIKVDGPGTPQSSVPFGSSTRHFVL
jgi:hypothetical protein